ncbi:hypothetical protein H0H81_011475 [Sphagnurus paluster]|uniref:ACB domain-containing protein n=1 Tax=Sphagnurus paluster TaxID=117069 RepID=A0A9P7KHJ3_9AGAR|nr:hypothetical protein H0H81_011475 [Sphagnurus paluster]
MPGRAKWDAWDSAGKKYTEALHAQSRYLEIARNLGWSEETVLEPPKPEQSDPDSVWDDETQLNTGGRSGMGGSVSSMAPPEDQADRSIHGLAVSNDIPGLIELLGNHAEVDVNELDEFVRLDISFQSPRSISCGSGLYSAALGL